MALARERKSQATFVQYGYGQVEPNHLSAQRTGQIYAQLPAAANIDVLENGQFVKYDYANKQVNFTGAGEWMLVFNEVKVYREDQSDADFAMIKDNYVARVYSPIIDKGSNVTANGATVATAQLNANMDQYSDIRNWGTQTVYEIQADGTTATRIIRNLTSADPYELDSTDNPFQGTYDYRTKDLMPGTYSATTAMVPRVFKTNVGDIYTTNTLMSGSTTDPKTAIPVYPELGDVFVPNGSGYLEKDSNGTTSTAAMQWQVVKLYDLGDRQPAVKLMRIV